MTQDAQEEDDDFKNMKESGSRQRQEERYRPAPSRNDTNKMRIDPVQQINQRLCAATSLMIQQKGESFYCQCNLEILQSQWKVPRPSSFNQCTVLIELGPTNHHGSQEVSRHFPPMKSGIHQSTQHRVATHRHVVQKDQSQLLPRIIGKDYIPKLCWVDLCEEHVPPNQSVLKLVKGPNDSL